MWSDALAVPSSSSHTARRVAGPVTPLPNHRHHIASPGGASIVSSATALVPGQTLPQDVGSMSVGDGSDGEGKQETRGAARSATGGDVAKLWTVLVASDPEIASLMDACVTRHALLCGRVPSNSLRAVWCRSVRYQAESLTTTDVASMGLSEQLAEAQAVVSKFDAKWRQRAEGTGFISIAFLRGVMHRFRRQWCVCRLDLRSCAFVSFVHHSSPCRYTPFSCLTLRSSLPMVRVQGIVAQLNCRHVGRASHGKARLDA